MHHKLPRIEISAIRDALEKMGLVRFTAIFGSHLNGGSDYFSDINLLLVSEEHDESSGPLHQEFSYCVWIPPS